MISSFLKPLFLLIIINNIIIRTISIVARDTAKPTAIPAIAPAVIGTTVSVSLMLESTCSK